MSVNNQRIIDWVDGRFAGVTKTAKMLEQKEELQTHMEDMIREYMADGKDFEQAFAAVKEDLGDLDELLLGESFKINDIKNIAHGAIDRVFDNRSNDPVCDRPEVLDPEDFGDFNHRGMSGRADFEWKFRFNHEGLVALSPFIYLFLGFYFGWWAWGWMIIPVSGILFSGSGGFAHRMVCLSPFIYIALGVTMGWWAWGWTVIPIMAIVFEGGLIQVKHRSKKTSYQEWD